MGQQQLSRFFTLNELCASEVARRDDVANAPDATQVAALRLLAVNVLDPLRAAIDTMLIIRSGFRSAVLNGHPDVRGAAKSQHLLGEAADVVAPAFAGGDVVVLMHKLVSLNLPFDQAILEDWNARTRRAKWIHVSHKRLGQQRGEVLTMARDPDGTPRYFPGLP